MVHQTPPEKSLLTISVVLCAYNEEAWLGRTLASLMQQKRLPDELVIVNNASTDGTEAIIQQFITAHPDVHIIYINEPRKGIHHARETGWRAAHGDIITTTDADITFPPNWLETIENTFADPRVDALTGTVRYNDALPFINWMTWACDQVFQPERIGKLFTKQYTLSGGNSAFRRHVLEAVNGYVNPPPGVVEDEFLSQKIHAGGYEVRFVRRLVVGHTFRRFNKEGWRGYLKYIFGYTVANIYPDHLADIEENQVKIAVVIPAYNEESLLRRCLDSVAQQQPPPDEIVVVNNASTDRTAEIIQTFITDHPELKISSILETKKGSFAARDAGWRAASSNTIVQIDADSILPPGWMAKVQAALAADPTVGVIGGTIQHENAPFSIAFIQLLLDLIYPRLHRLITGFPYIWAAMTICKREILEKMDGYANKPQDKLEDYYFSEQAHKLGYKLRYMPSIYAIHSSRRYETGGLRAWLKWQMAAIDAKQYPDDVR